jgi:hypothetical protein
MMTDMAILTGGQVIAEEMGLKLETLQLNVLGKCRRALIDKDNTTLVGGAGKKAEIQARLSQIRTQIEQTTSDYDREKLEERLAKLVGGVGVIKVGAATEVELKERKARVDDAVHALRAAVEEGVVPGGGVALARAVKDVEALKLPPERKAGADIVARAMSEPLRQIARNAGGQGRLRLQCRQRPVRRPGQGRRDRSGQGRALGAGERGQRGLDDADDGSRDRRSAAQSRAGTCDAAGRRDGWHAGHGWNGRHGWYGRYGWNGRYGRYGRRIYRRRGFLVRLQLPRPAV